MKRILLSSAVSLLFPLLSAQAQFCVARDGTLKAANAANNCARGLRPYVAPISNVTVGAKGDKGDQGEKGDKGDVGAQGPQGLAGAQGARGEAGAVGPQGVKGDKGDVGPQGIRGATGATGAAGSQGMKGATGATGPVGPMGAVGPQGEPGAPSFFPPSDLVGGIAKFDTLHTDQAISFSTYYSGGVIYQGATGYGVSKGALLECGKFFITRIYCNTSGYREKITAKISEVSFPGSSGLQSKNYFSVPITSSSLHMGFAVPYFIDLTKETHCSLGNQVALSFEADAGQFGGSPIACEVDVVSYR